MNIMVVSGEAVPFAKTGGLADVAGALPKYLSNAGVNTSLVMPLYQKVAQSGAKLVKLKPAFKVTVGDTVYPAAIWKSFLPESETPVYFIDQKEFFNRAGLYGVDGKDYTDNCKRFSFFCRGALELIKALDLKIDILHLNDWQTALIPAYIKSVYADDPYIHDIATLYTIHNLAYQGLFWHWDMPITGLPWEFFNWTQLEFFGKLSFMKAGLTFADALSTVSKEYAREIQSEENGAGLDEVLKQRGERLFGVVNGVDYNVWSPEVDELIPANYTMKDMSGKAECKAELQRQQGNLPVKPNVPLIGLISRLVDQKGFDLIAEMFDDLMTHELQFVLLGIGEAKYHKMFEKLAKKYPAKVAVNLTFDNRLAHLIEAGCDMYLMPSRYEPCGLNQIYSLKYGAVPIVHATGGLKDTIINVADETLKDNTATGFSFDDYKAPALLYTIKRAMALYSQKNGWKRLVVNCMKQDWSWERAAGEYIEIYKWTLKNRKASGKAAQNAEAG